MSDLVLYHGSTQVVMEPSLAFSRIDNDYGAGFYCTVHGEMAKEWACRDRRDGVLNEYRFDESGMRVLNLNDSEYCILHWVAMLAANRSVESISGSMVHSLAWLQERFGLDVRGVDIIRGNRADDSYFAFTRAFLRGELTLGQLSRAMNLGELGEQYVLVSEDAFAGLSFSRFEFVDGSRYYPLSAERDQLARREYQRIQREDGSGASGDGARIFDLMRMGEDELHACLF